jgi:hypothetical protein
VRREGSEVVLEVGDDGAGLNRKAIRKRAEERGLIRNDAVLADADLDALIMEPGFSTADTVSRLAGRGVGMDVVASEVRQLGGALDIKSKQGEGTTFTLRLPQTLAVTQAVFVKIGETTYRGADRLGARRGPHLARSWKERHHVQPTAARTTRCTTWACCSATRPRRPKASCRCRCC